MSGFKTDFLFWIGNLSFALTALSFLVRDVLLLRVLSIAAGLTGLYYDFRVPDGPRWLVIFWVSLFIAINLFQIVVLLLERRPVALATEEAELRASVFPGLTAVEFRKLLRIATWRSFAEATVIARAGHDIDDVLVVSHGRVDVIKAGTRVGEWVTAT